MRRNAPSAAAVTFWSNGSRAIQKASLLPNPPGTRLASPMTWPKKNPLTQIEGRRRSSGRAETGDEDHGAEQPIEPANERHLERSARSGERGCRTDPCGGAIARPHHAAIMTKASATMHQKGKAAAGARDDQRGQRSIRPDPT